MVLKNMDKKKVIQNKEEEEKKKKAALETKIRKRVAAEEKAYRVVERFVDETVSEDFLKDAGQLITPSHYDDIVVERAIAKLCGYPICKNILTNVSKQKYQISTRTNKVYDITERKNFCSNQCYKSSKYFQKQISDTPVWGRENEPRVQFDLLSLDSKSGSSGLEVIGGKTEVMAEITHLAKLDRYESNQKQKVNKGDKNQHQSEDQLSNMENMSTSSDIEKGDTTERHNDFCTQVAGGETSSRNFETESIENSEAEETKSANKHKSIIQSDNSKVEVTKSASQSEIDAGAEGTKSTRLEGEQSDKNIIDCKNLNNTELEDTKNESKPCNMEQVDNQAKIDYLMKLLDKRKHLLNKMAQIETVDVVRKDDRSPSEGSKIVTTGQDVCSTAMKLEDQFSYSCNVSKTETVELGTSAPIFLEKTECDENDDRKKEQRKETILKSNNDNKILDNRSGKPR
ncbi:hypothetical protein KUTeg_022409 [Tegillarca granosa]|uniref:RNA polymerase II subunit B1 CTD phosphatase RPAP2 homolog n=1 Tax=Tegillarca granosa TaxID=220873 RepID=A0ABQ9E6W7_TEGGR|nr:hypothetical protein KUTeg_022409 [Tegillarca granosa]